MIVHNMSNRDIHELSIKSHEYVLRQCEKIESLYHNLELEVNHNSAMEYEILFKNKSTGKIVDIYDYNMPGKVKNYLKGLIDAKITYMKY